MMFAMKDIHRYNTNGVTQQVPYAYIENCCNICGCLGNCSRVLIWPKMQKHQKCHGWGRCFYINRFDRRLDSLGGGGDPKLFHKITFADVMCFVKFDLEANDIFLLGVAPVLHLWRVHTILSVNTYFTNV